MVTPTAAGPVRRSANGFQIPAVGFGTWPLKGADAVESVQGALAAGYRLLDSAVNYENEGAVGVAVRNGAVPREEVTVTSKLPGRHHAYDEALACVQESVYRTGLDRIDLYLIHWPNPRVGRYVEAWQALLEAKSRGLVGQVGVSNFLPEHLAALVEATGVAPAVNQVELHPQFPQVDLLGFHEEHGIVTEAWRPLGSGADLLGDPVVQRVAATHQVSPGQAVLRWHVQRGVVPLPKSSSPVRQRENLDLFGFELTAQEMAAITGLGRPDGRTKDQDPAVHEEF